MPGTLSTLSEVFCCFFWPLPLKTVGKSHDSGCNCCILHHFHFIIDHHLIIWHKKVWVTYSIIKLTTYGHSKDYSSHCNNQLLETDLIKWCLLLISICDVLLVFVGWQPHCSFCWGLVKLVLPSLLVLWAWVLVCMFLFGVIP